MKLDYGFFGIGIRVSYNGMPLHVLSRHGTMRLRTASNVLMLIGGVAFLLGMGAIMSGAIGRNFAVNPMDSIRSLIPAMLGAAIIILAIFIRRGSLGATITATVLFGIYLVTAVGFAVVRGMATDRQVSVHSCSLVLPILVFLSLIYSLKEVKILIRDREMWDRPQTLPKVAVPQGKAPPPSA